MSHALWHPRFRVRADVLLPAAATRPRPAPRRTGPGKTLGLDDSSREIYYPDNIQPSPGPGLMCKLMCVCVWCPARMSGNGGMHYSDRTHISHEILAVFSFLVCHVMKDPNLLKGEVRSVDSHHALTPSRTFLSFPSFDSGIPQGEESVGVLLPSERALCFAESELLDTLRAFDVAHSCGRYVW